MNKIRNVRVHPRIAVALKILIGVGLIVALVLLLHRFIWPAVLRLLYLVQGSGVLTQRKSLLSIGLALTSAAVLSPAGIVTVVKGLIGLK